MSASAVHPRRRRWLDACDGPFPKLPNINAGWLRKRLEGEHETLRRAVAYIAEEIEQRQGQRFQISSRVLGRALGMSQSTGSRCLRRLRALGIIALWRAHRVQYEAPLRRWTGTAAIHEVVFVGGMTHPSGEGPPDPRRVSHEPLPVNI